MDTLVQQFNSNLRSFFDKTNDWVAIFFQFDVFLDSDRATVDGDFQLFARLGQRSDQDFVGAGLDLQLFEIRSLGQLADQNEETRVGRAVFRQHDVFGSQRNRDAGVAEGVDFASADLARGTSGLSSPKDDSQRWVFLPKKFLKWERRSLCPSLFNQLQSSTLARAVPKQNTRHKTSFIVS